MYCQNKMAGAQRMIDIDQAKQIMVMARLVVRLAR